MKIRHIMFACAFAVSTASAADLVLPATLIRVVDGDGLVVQLDSGPIEVRLHGIDAPERRQAHGRAATKLLRTLVEGEPLELEVIEQRDSYNRLIAKVFVRGEDVNARMIDSGYAWAYRRYLRRDPVDEEYCRLEAGARDDGRGLWIASPESFEPPWVFRARRAGRAVPAIDYRHETADTCLAAIGRKTTRPASAGGRSPPAGSQPGCDIKGNINARGDRIYHLPGSPSYANTRIDTENGERWFCTVAEAETAGWRAPRQ